MCAAAPACTLACADAIEDVIEFEGPETIAAVFLEPVQNGGGAIPPPEGYFARVREICDRYGVLLVSDEVICAFGRLGYWFGCERYDYLPDIITTAKAMTSGYSPLGAMITRDFLVEPFLEGNQVVLTRHHVRRPSGQLRGGARQPRHLRARGPARACAEPRGRVPRPARVAARPAPSSVKYAAPGTSTRIELVKDKETKETFDDDESEELLRGFLSPRLFEAGLICRVDDRGDPVIQLSPPLDRRTRAVRRDRDHPAHGPGRGMEADADVNRTSVVGIPRELKDGEHRVAVTPDGVRELVAHNHRVLVERGAGAGSSISDDELAAAGAELVAVDDAWAADLVVKVKEPQPEEYGRLRPDLVLFTYLHLAAYPEVAAALLEAKTTALAYETVQLENGVLPLLAPMSEVAGRMATQIGAHYLEAENGGRGVLLGGAPGVRPARCVVIGAGNVGWNSAWIAQGMEAEVWLLDKSIDRLRWVDQIHRGRIMTLTSNRGAVERAVAEADLLIGAVLVPGGRAPMVVTADMVRGMRARVGDRRHRGRSGWVHRDHPRDDARRPGVREVRRHPLRRRQCAGCSPPHVDLRAHQRHAPLHRRSRRPRGPRSGRSTIPSLLGGVTTVGGAVTNAAVAEALGREATDPLSILQD